ncbi:MAG: DsbE family thiol:disulfide interchange protein [Sterolibacterium sp.]|nr:DsbE family thiol:disulfide interchange protein [Sterolibacterium sp.]
MKRFLIPVVLFILLLALLAIGLNLNPREVPSPLVGKPAPAFTLSRLDDAGQTFSPADMRGQVWLLNVWASWCVSCRAEHPLLVSFAKQGLVPVIGLNYKEVRGDGELDILKLAADEEEPLVRGRAQAWLDQRGDPYQLTVLDMDGRVGIDYGVYGVPETYVIDKAGIIRYKQIGPLTPDVLRERILPLVKELEGQAG